MHAWEYLFRGNAKEPGLIGADMVDGDVVESVLGERTDLLEMPRLVGTAEDRRCMLFAR